ncbi:MAG: AIM24 family protein [Victivallales bacterium]|nr:AIM24 family protein [Victivallales bacterium]
MMENEYSIEQGAIRLDGDFDLIFRPGSVMAYSGTIQAGMIPLRKGTCLNWLARVFEPDRFMLRHAMTKGSLWLGVQNCPYVTTLPSADESVVVRSELLLCAELSQRLRGDRFRLLPGSLQKVLTLTELQSAEGLLSPVVCTASPLNEARLEEGETLHVSPSALVAWSGCPKPTAFCSHLRFRDIFLPRLPETLTLDFKGPGRVFFQGAASAERKTPKRYGF